MLQNLTLFTKLRLVFWVIASTLAFMNSKRQFLKTGAAGSLGAAGLYTAMPKAYARNDSRTGEAKAAHALNRLGYGPLPNDIARIKADPMAWVEQQLAPAQNSLPASLTGKLTESIFTDSNPVDLMREFSEALKNNRVAQQTEAAAMTSMEQSSQTSQTTENAPRLATGVAMTVRYNYPALQSRLVRGLESPNQLQEVMVDFWFNHFNVFQGKNLLRVLMGHYEHNAIRPHALGRFRDLLGATAKHPAMLFYLDNAQSVAASAGRTRGLNENYARELMELHTLGVDAGYTQTDVTELARILTGWTFTPLRNSNANTEKPGFWFNQAVHDRAEKNWLGHKIAASGLAEGEFALDVLAKHPATAAHLAFKLAQYFVSDQPAPALIEKLTKVYLETDGQITPVLRTLFNSDIFWSNQNLGVKFKSPHHYTLSALRACGVQLKNVQGIANQLSTQGQPLYGCQTPDGYKNTESAWLNPDAMIKRINFANQVAQGRLGPETVVKLPSAEQLIADLGPLVSANTKKLALEQKTDPQLALALILAGPNMMRR